MSTPSLHKCDACEKEKRKSYIGHDIAWCRVLRKTEKTEEATESCQEETKDESQTEQENEVWADAPTKSFPNPSKKKKKRSKSKSKEITSPGLIQNSKFQLLSTSSDQPEAILSATPTIQIQPKNPKNPQHPKTRSETRSDKNIETELLDKNHCSLIIRDKKSDSTIINTYVNPKQYNFQPLKDTIEKLELTSDQNIYMGGDFNAIDPSDINEEKKTFSLIVKPNDIRLLRSKELIQLNSSLLLTDLAQLLKRRQPTHFETRSGKQNRIDQIFSNNQNLTIEKNAIETLPFAFSDHKCLHCFRNSNF